MLKRIFDIIVSTVLLLALSPLALAISALVVLDTRGPVLHRAVRVGRHGRPFTMYKFRSMVADARHKGPAITRAGDPRITGVGHILRGLKLDEIPQLVNVLKGEMSMVGPRPEDPRYVADYSDEQRQLLMVRPGIASPASIKYATEETLLSTADENWEQYYLSRVLPDKLRIDLDYIQRQSLLGDISILVEIGVMLPARLMLCHSLGGRASRPLVLAGETPALPADGFTAFLDRRDRSLVKGIMKLWQAHRRFVRQYVPWHFIDAFVVASSLSLAWIIRSISVDLDLASALPFWLVAIAVYCTANHVFHLYQRIWRYASAGEIVVIAAAVAISTILLAASDILWPGRQPVPLGVVAETGLFTLIGFVGMRYRRRLWTGFLWRWRVLRGQFPSSRKATLIVGAGEAGQLLAWRFQNLKEGEEYQLVGYTDDDRRKWGKRIHGLPVLGGRDSIPELVGEYRVELIVLALGDIPGDDFRAILDICEQTPAMIKILPNIFHLIKSTDSAPPIRDVTAEDLLGRKTADLDTEAGSRLIDGKVVLVTGAAGSIGSELCRQILAFQPRRVILLDNNESGLHDLVVMLGLRAIMEKRGHWIVPVVADITNTARVETIFARYQPQVVFHAAAYKHVPLMEEQPEEAVRVNVFGTRIVAESATRWGTERFVFVSTDKAINPTSMMGATKFVAEMLIANVIAGNTERDPAIDGARPRVALFTSVRFGNVLGSRGSVVPTFEHQIQQGGPVTVTDPAMTRFFLSIPEAASLILQAAALTQGSDVFVLDMGQQIKIDALARRLIRLRGLRPDVDVPIVYTGARPGEKLREELLGIGEEALPTDHPCILRIERHGGKDPEWVWQRIDALIHAAEMQRRDEVVTCLVELTRLCRSEKHSIEVSHDTGALAA